MCSHRFTRLVTLALVAVLVMALAPARLERAQAAGGVLAYGDRVTGQISNASYFELWEFAGNKGDFIQVLMEGDVQLDAYLGVIDKVSQQVLAEDDDSGGGSNAYIEMTLPASGAYVIVATRYNFDVGTSQGKYALSLAGNGAAQNVSNTPPAASTEPVEVDTGVWYMGDIALSEPASGTIDSRSFAQLYSLDLQAGTEIVVAMLADGSTLDPYLIFVTEDGDVLAEDNDSGAQVGVGKTDAVLALTIDQSGTYFVIATRAGADQGMSSGAYVLIAAIPDTQGQGPVQEQPTADDNLPDGVDAMGMIQVGQQASGAISADSFIHLYGFDGQAGEQVTITMRGTGGLDSYLGVIDPNDEVIAEDDDSAGGSDAQISIRLPESGTYVIVVTRNGLDAGMTTGSYTLDVTSGAPPAPEGQTGLGGFGGLPGRAFEVEGGQTFYLRGFGASSDPAKNPPIKAFALNSTLPGRPSGLRINQISLNFEEIKWK
jgi:hypothetical protein